MRKTLGSPPEAVGPRRRIPHCSCRVGLVATCIMVVTACGEGFPARDVAGLDAELLATVSRRFAPLAHFSGSPVSQQESFLPSAAARPADLQRSAAPDATERRHLMALGRSVEQLARSGPVTAPILRIRALWTLLSEPNPSGHDRAVQLFQAALTHQPQSTERKNDLAAALLLRASFDRQPEDVASALDLLDPIMDERQPAPAALFNRAYALQRLTLWDAAQETWSRLPGRQAKTVKPAKAESAPLPSTSSIDILALRRHGEWLLGEWATKRLRGETKVSEDILRQAEEIGSRLQTSSGDRLLREAIVVIHQAERSNPARLHLLMRGHARFHAVRGTELYSQCRPDALRRAEASLAAAASPFVGWVRLDQAICAYFDKDFSRAESLLTSLRKGAAKDGFLALQGRAEWILGLVRMVQARFVEADHHYSSAIYLFQRLGEEAHVIYLRS